LHCAAGTRHWAFSVTGLGVEPQDAKLEGATERLTFDVLAFAIRVIPEALGLQVKESALVPVPIVAGNVIVTGLTAQVAFGDELEELRARAEA